MDNSSLLTLFGWSFIAVMLLMIVVPYIRKRSDLLTTWNLFLLGSANFVGFSTLASASLERHYRDYTRNEYLIFMVSVVVFYLTAAIAYRFFKYPRRAAGRRFRKWPPVSRAVLFSVQMLAIAVAVFYRFVPAIPVLTPLVRLVGDKMIAFAVVMAFIAWYRKKSNLILLTTFLGTLLAGILLSILAGFGRRPLVGVLLAIPICVYWLDLRYRSTRFNLTLASAFGVGFVVLIGAWSTLRGFDAGINGKERNVENVLAQLQKMPERISNFQIDILYGLLGQNATECSLLCIRMFPQEQRIEPFNAIFFVASNPIPRQFWEDKPLSLGYVLPHLYYGGKTLVNWGPGIVGHAFHEGGMHMLVIYAILMAGCLRFFDEVLVRQSSNAYILALFAAMSGHILVLPRGDIGVASLQIVAAVIAIFLVGYLGRMVFGTQLVYPRTDQKQYMKLTSMLPVQG